MFTTNSPSIPRFPPLPQHLPISPRLFAQALKRCVPPDRCLKSPLLVPPPLTQLFLPRVMEWLRHVDLSEYAPNLRGSGVHGALLVMEKRCSFLQASSPICCLFSGVFLVPFFVFSGLQLSCLPHFSPFLVPNPFLGINCPTLSP